ncbi:DUF4148 domain-containing protein [Robbsia sp. KACC 23696]|uniref:DUF4148 domain-containing protein n=1 Tax=Robbsia sp. KACC 23696 TaxID=3149231 RepID=UPI00325AA878
MNRNVIRATLVAAFLAAPALSFAQASSPVTHAGLIHELALLEKAGYNPANPDPNYPANLQAAEAKVALTPGVSAVVLGSASNGQIGAASTR